MSAPKPLPEKICITGRGINLANFKKAVREKHANASTRGLELEPDDLTPEARAKYDAYYTEKARRKDPAQPGVAQEALDALEHCRANKLSTNLLHQCGYSTRATVKLAVAEEKRIVREL
ncbi:MAG: hypothetical protein GY838_12770, partial [bacterium]|nr:hypothetical protein [bacterium]